MNKRDIVKIFLVLTSILFTILFQIQVENSGFVFLIPLLFLLTIYMYKYKNAIMKCKFIYDVILMLLMFFSTLTLVVLIINISNIVENINISSFAILVFGYLYFILKNLLDSLITLKQNNDKISDYLIIVVFSIINLVFIRYYFDISHVLFGSLEKVEFIQQNYIYFFIMLLIIELHKYISRKLLK